MPRVCSKVSWIEAGTSTVYLVRPLVRPWMLSQSPDTTAFIPGIFGLISSVSGSNFSTSSGFVKRIMNGVPGGQFCPQEQCHSTTLSGPKVRNE